jgi:hypothetical protein
MGAHRIELIVLSGTYAICRLPSDAAFPAWATGELVCITRTADELSVVCREDAVPEGARCERGWRCLRVAGTLGLSLVGVLASLLVPLAGAGVGVFAISTFDTDYLLVREADLARATEALRAAGHQVAATGT